MGPSQYHESIEKQKEQANRQSSQKYKVLLKT